MEERHQSVVVALVLRAKCDASKMWSPHSTHQRINEASNYAYSCTGKKLIIGTQLQKEKEKQ